MELAGTFNVKGQYVDSINYLTVVQQVGFFGPKRAVNCVSYICVSGDGAWTVDVGFLNSDSKDQSFAALDKYQGWNGSAFVDGPAVPRTVAGEDYYWYRRDVHWKDDPSVKVGWHAVALQRKGAGPLPASGRLSFKVWAFRHSN